MWAVMQPRLEQYANNYLEGVSRYKDLLAEIIKNDKLHDKYFEIFDMSPMRQ